VYSPDAPSTNRVAVELLGWQWKDDSRNWFGCPDGVMRLGSGQGFPALSRFGALFGTTLVYFGKGKIDRNVRFSRGIRAFLPKTGG